MIEAAPAPGNGQTFLGPRDLVNGRREEHTTSNVASIRARLEGIKKARELAELPGGIRRQGFKEGLTHPGIVLGLERKRASLAIQDLLELLPDLFERTAEATPDHLLVAIW